MEIFAVVMLVGALIAARFKYWETVELSRRVFKAEFYYDSFRDWHHEVMKDMRTKEDYEQSQDNIRRWQRRAYEAEGGQKRTREYWGKKWRESDTHKNHLLKENEELGKENVDLNDRLAQERRRSNVAERKLDTVKRWLEQSAKQI